ncbi:MAG: MBL fold metallo-hydrolase [Actinomycetaceae bacterium]|nr:MBL fold metallo-hydrolase [Actinomycetaceae bacterium]
MGSPDTASPPVTLRFLGAAGTVTGSKYLLSIGNRHILVDAGMFQGDKKWRERNWRPFPHPAHEITDILITHAHMDHVGYLPALVKEGFSGTIWATPGTIRLTQIVLRDAGYLQVMEAREAQKGGYSKHADPKPLYTPEDVEVTLTMLRAVDYDQPLDLDDDICATWVRAGHILGSASIHLQIDSRSVLFSGDLGRHDPPVLKPRAKPPAADWVLMESTYGDREHAEPDRPHENMAAAIRRTVERGGHILMPAFAIDRTEAVLKAITDLMRAKRIPSIPVFVDSPMGLNALDVYRDLSLDELKDDIEIDDFLGIPQLTEARTSDDSKRINTFRHSCIIVSSSGMLEGGRVLHHLERILPGKQHCLIITGYQATGTRGRALIDGARNVKIHGQYIPVRAEVVQDREFSAHADASDLIDWLRDLDREPHTVFLTHGEGRASRALAERITEELGWNVVLPGHGEVVSLRPIRREGNQT